jgi:amino acid transporter
VGNVTEDKMASEIEPTIVNTTAVDPGETSPNTLTRGLGLFDSTMLVAGSMIGSGIFIVSSSMARQVGSAGWLLLSWVITGALTLAAALSYGELAAMMPRAGGQYVYLHQAYSPLCGFLYGWTLFLVIQTGTIAAVAIGFARRSPKRNISSLRFISCPATQSHCRLPSLLAS